MMHPTTDKLSSDTMADMTDIVEMYSKINKHPADMLLSIVKISLFR